MKDMISTAATLILALVVSSETASAQISRDEKYVIIGTTSKTVGYMAPWVGKIKGFFQAEGVRVDIPILRSATTGVQALVGGSTQFDATTVDAMISAADKGQEALLTGWLPPKNSKVSKTSKERPSAFRVSLPVRPCCSGSCSKKMG